MSMAYDDPIRIHKEWLGYLQPVGLVVVPTAMVKAGVVVDTHLLEPHARFLEALGKWAFNETGEQEPVIHDWASFAHDVLDWQDRNLVKEPEALQLHLPDYQETLRPTYGVRNPMKPAGDSADGTDVTAWMMLIQELPKGTALDRPAPVEGHHWQATPQERFERLLRETQVSTGLLVNGREVRLVYAPKGETSGYLTFPVKAMSETTGRLIFGAFRELLSSERLFTAATEQWLPTILSDSRKAQAEVSTALAQQVLSALYELLRGFQTANAKSKGKLLDEVLEKEPNRVYRGLLTVLLRLVFLKFAEERDLLSRHGTFLQHYSVAGLFDRLREDYAQFVDTMDLRYGAWAQLLVLFRLTYDGCDFTGEDGRLHLPPRHGYLFDPDRFPFLEAREMGSTRQGGENIQTPLVSDLVVYRVLEKLLILDGERIAYRGLDVEQIGSIYESMMGFSLHVAGGPTVAIKSVKAHGAPACVNLDELLEVAGPKRKEWLQKQTDQKLTGKADEALKSAASLDDLAAALAQKIDPEASPNRRAVPAGSLILQPSLERRRSGSHYTPRSLTSRIVSKTLMPILQRLGKDPKPEAILALKVLDPAVGSGAFLVEACRTLAELLVMAWRAHDQLPKLNVVDEPLTHARRLVAQHCLYGVDRNPMAVDLAKLSLWLVTLAEDHPFTFLDHAIRHGDSLVGVWVKDFATLYFDETGSGGMVKEVNDLITTRVEEAKQARQAVQDSDDSAPEAVVLGYMADFDKAVSELRVLGDVLVQAFFTGKNAKERKAKRTDAWALVHQWLSRANEGEALKAMASGLRQLAIHPFHWELEFPEVFFRENPGFDAIVGNPPFVGGKHISSISGDEYADWLMNLHEKASGGADLVAHFFRRAFDLLRWNAAFGLIATNTISQGDTRNTGLRWIRMHQGTIFAATRRMPWPGAAAVVVSVVHVHKGLLDGPSELDGRTVSQITAFLFHAGPDQDPARLEANAGKSFVGSYVLGMGFTFDDTDTKGVANSLAEMERLIAADPRNRERIFPYIGGEEVNSDPEHHHHRYVINFEDFPLGRRELKPAWEEATEKQQREYLCSGLVPFDYPEAVAEDWQELIGLVRAKVKPDRDVQKRDALRERWWQYADKRPGLYATIQELPRVLVIARVGQQGAFTFLPAQMVYSEQLIVFPLPTCAAFAALQSQPHELWSRFMGSTLEERLRYTPEDCFETYPFPPAFEHHAELEQAGQACYEYRAALMVQNQQGLTATYNRFHNPQETDPGILQLRALHRSMDEAVLCAYGWGDLELEYDFYPDFEPIEDEDGEPAKVRLRYRWPNWLREEVLGRLLDLNAQRAAEEEQIRQNREALYLKPAKSTSKRGRKHKTLPMAAETVTQYLIDPEDMG